MKAKLTLNTSKSKMTFFSLDSVESKWQPIIAISGVKLPCNRNLIFLGFTYKRQLSFSEQTLPIHGNQNKSAMTLLRHVLGLVQSRSLSSIHHNTGKTGRIHNQYPWLSATNICKLERVQQEAASAITHQARSTLVKQSRGSISTAGFLNYQSE